MQDFFASTPSPTGNASVREWSNPLTIFSKSAQGKKEDYSIALSGCSLRHPQE